MQDGVTSQGPATTETANHDKSGDKELNFRRLEEAREKEREARIRAEMEAQNIRKEIESLKEMLKPKEKDPLDDEDLDSDLRAKLRAIRERDRLEILKASKDIARQTFEEEKGREKRENPSAVLRKEYPDYDQFINNSTIQELSETHPEFVEAVLKIPDEYERRQVAYKFVKSQKGKVPLKDERKEIQEKVKENQQNPYFTSGSQGMPAVDFDIRSPEARQNAYHQLRAAQKRPIEGGRR